MSYVIDRRLNGKNKSTVNRQRFLQRYRGHIKKAVEEAVRKTEGKVQLRQHILLKFYRSQHLPSRRQHLLRSSRPERRHCLGPYPRTPKKSSHASSETFPQCYHR